MNAREALNLLKKIDQEERNYRSARSQVEALVIAGQEAETALASLENAKATLQAVISNLTKEKESLQGTARAAHEGTFGFRGKT